MASVARVIHQQVYSSSHAVRLARNSSSDTSEIRKGKTPSSTRWLRRQQTVRNETSDDCPIELVGVEWMVVYCVGSFRKASEGGALSGKKRVQVDSSGRQASLLEARMYCGEALPAAAWSVVCFVPACMSSRADTLGLWYRQPERVSRWVLSCLATKQCTQVDCGAAPGSWSQVAAQRTHANKLKEEKLRRLTEWRQ